MIIRHGEEKDIKQCLILAENFYEVAGYKDAIPFCADSSEEYMNISLGMGLLSVAEDNSNIVGFILGLAVPHIMNKKYLVGTELAWYIDPAYRKGSAGIKLLKHIETSAKEMGCKMWSMMCLESQNPEQIEKIYLSLGYKKTERSYTRVF